MLGSQPSFSAFPAFVGSQQRHDPVWSPNGGGGGGSLGSQQLAYGSQQHQQHGSIGMGSSAAGVGAGGMRSGGAAAGMRSFSATHAQHQLAATARQNSQPLLRPTSAPVQQPRQASASYLDYAARARPATAAGSGGPAGLGHHYSFMSQGKSSQGLEELRAPATATYAPLDVRGVPEPYLQPQSQAETHGRLDVLKDEIQALTLQTGKLAESSAKLDQMMELCTAVSSKVDQLAESMAIQAQLNAVPRPTLAEASAQTDPQTMAQVASLPKQMHGGGANTLRKHPAAKRSAAAAADGTPATTRSMQGHRGEQGSKAPASADHQQLALRPESVVTSGQHGASSTPGGSPTPLPCWGTKRARHVAAPAALQQAAATPLPPVASQPVQPVQQHVARQAKASGSAHAGGAPRPGSTIPPPRPTAAAKPAATRAPVAPALSLMGSSLMLLLASAAPTAAPAAAPGSRKSAKLYGSDGAGAGGDDDDLGDELDEDIAREIAARRQRHRSKRTKRLLSMQPAPSYHR